MSMFIVIVVFWGIMFGLFFFGEEVIVCEYFFMDCVFTRLNGKAWNIMMLFGWVLFVVVCVLFFVVLCVNVNVKYDVDVIIVDEEVFMKEFEGMFK